MNNQSEIFARMKNIIPAELWEQFGHLSFGEMAEINELSEWSNELRRAETEWFSTSLERL